MIHAPASGLGWVQWVNLELAEGWRSKCRALVGSTPPDGSIASNLETQFAATLALWEAVSGWLLACDLPAPVFVPYARAVLVTTPQTWRPDLVRALRQYSPDYVEHDSTTFVEVSRRMSFSNASVLDSRYLRSPVAPTPTQGLDFQRSGYDAVNQTIWGAWVFSEWYPGALTAGDGRAFGLTPVREMYLTGLAMANFIGGRTVEEALDACRNYAAMKNLQTARTIAPRALPAEVNTLLIRTRSDDELLNTRVSSDLTTAAEVGAAAAAALGPLAPMAALVVGALSGLPALLQTAFGTAVGYNVDAFGRREPVLEKTSISGSLAPRIAPTHAVPLPPSVLIRGPLVQIERGESRPPVIDPGSKSSSGSSSSSGSKKMLGGLVLLAVLVSNSGKGSR